MALLRIQIFLAASSDLAEDRREIEVFFNRENKALLKSDIFLELVVWEDFIESMSRARFQHEYNNAINRSDIFITLIGKRAGAYADEEFEIAFSQFKELGKPFILTYFKKASTKENELQLETLDADDFKAKLIGLGHYGGEYRTVDELKYRLHLQLEGIINRLKKTSKPVELNQKKTPIPKNKVFISYSHTDSEYLNRLLIHLKPLIKKGVIDLWVDSKLKVGEKWQVKIEEALQSASVAILLISADFLASDFIIDNELPPLLNAADVNGTKIIPVVIKPCRFTRHQELSSFQAINAPDKPLMGLTEFEKETIYDKIAEWVEVNTKY
jgi:hypothetical protein